MTNIVKGWFDDISAAQNKNLPDEAFKWRDRHGHLHHPSDMATQHLFYTVRMIWNHTMPKKLYPYTRYSFGKFYSDSYMKNAVRSLVAELATRHDLTTEQERDLQHMLEWLRRPQIKDSCEKPS